MSHDPCDDDILDAALRQLGAPDGAEPRASAGELLARAGAPVPHPVAPPPAPRVPWRTGLSGMPLAAALVAAVGTGFLAGALSTGTWERTVAPDATRADDVAVSTPVLLGRGEVPPQRPPDAAAPTLRAQETLATAPGTDLAGSAPPLGPAVAARTPASSARRRGRVRADDRPDAPPAAAVGVPSAEPATFDAPTDAAVARVATSVGALREAERTVAAKEEPPVPLPDTVADRAAGRRTRGAREVASREVDVPSARAGRLHVGVGGASSSLGVVVPSGDGAPGDTRAAELVVGYARRVSDTALAPWVGVELGAGRAWAVPHDADTRSVDPGPGLPTWSVDASGGVAWAVGPARVDLGLGVGTRGLPGGGWAPHRSDDEESAGTRPDARAPADAREPFDPAPSAPLALLGPRLNVSLGGDRGPRARLGLAPSVALRPGHRPDAWVQLSLGGEFPT